MWWTTCKFSTQKATTEDPWSPRAAESRSSGLNWETLLQWMMWRVIEKESQCQSQVFTSMYVHPYTWMHTSHVNTHPTPTNIHSRTSAECQCLLGKHKALQFPEVQGEAYVICEEMQPRHLHSTALPRSSCNSPSLRQFHLHHLMLTKRISTHLWQRVFVPWDVPQLCRAGWLDRPIILHHVFWLLLLLIVLQLQSRVRFVANAGATWSSCLWV